MRDTHRETKTHEVEVVDRVLCDWCKEPIKVARFEIGEVSVSCQTGCRYPDSGEIETVEFDMCVRCFETRLLPLLAAQGVGEPRKTQADW